jgi:alkaline phosphatase
MELAKIKGLSTGIVATCEYPHATPADFVCHFPNRRNYAILTKQFLYNSPDVVFAGGKGILETMNDGHSMKEFNDLKINLITNKTQLSRLEYEPGSIVWGLFPDWEGSLKSKSYQCDIIDPSTEPSLSEMTAKAIDILKQNKQGFMLMVEGSQIDWACHNNDPYAAVTEFLEFDKAVKIALDFAKNDKSTLVVVCPDHGNGGLTIGNARSHVSFNAVNPEQYDKIDIREKIIGPLKQVKFSARKLAGRILSDTTLINEDTIRYYYNISDPVITQKIRNIVSKNPMNALSDTLQYILGSNYSAEHFIGWTTTGHTAEDVFLALYVPEGVKGITGVVDNTEIAQYIASQMKLGNLKDLTETYFCRSDLLFADDPLISHMATKDSLVISKNDLQIIIDANTNRVRIKSADLPEKEIRLPTLAVCITTRPKGESVYYLPRMLGNYLR